MSKNSVCPECREPIGLGTYFAQVWLTRIDCPSCKKTIRVEGMGLYFGLTLPPAIVFGVLSHQVRLDHGMQGLMGLSAVFMLAVTALFVVALSTWVKLVRDEPKR